MSFSIENFIIKVWCSPLFKRIRQRSLDRAWREVQAELLEQVDNILLHGESESIHFKGHHYLYFGERYWIDKKAAKIDDFVELKRKIEEMEV